MKSDRTVRTTCSYCGVGCGIEVTKHPDGNLTLTGDGLHSVNRGKLCSKGLNLHYVVQNREDRLMHPMMRWSRDHPMEQVSWDTALNRASAVFTTLIQKHGPDSVAFYVSGQCLTEEYYVVNKLAKAGIGTNNIDTNSRLCMSSAVVGYKKALGEDAVPISYEDIDICDTLFISGANPAWCHPIIFRRIEERKTAFPGLKIIVADPRKTQSTAMADIHLQLTPGTDTVLNNAIGRCIIENGDCDDDFLAAHTEGFEAYRQIVFQTPVARAAVICGVEEAGIREAALYIGRSNGFVSMWAMGLNQSVEGVNKNLSLINLSLITGQIGKPGAGPFSLTGQPNAMGGREVGGMCNLLPAHRDLNNENHRREVAEFWKVPSIPARPGLSATEMIHALDDGRLKAIWIICTNPAVSIPNARLVDAAMARASFVVVQDISSRSDTVNYADLVLPAAGWLEKVGTMTNSDRRISMVNRLVDPPGEARPDAEILCDFAKRMKFDGFDFENEEAIFNEHRALTSGTNVDISGLSYDYLRENGSAQWPFPEGSTEGTPRLFSDFRFYTPSQKAQIVASSGMDLIEPLTKAFPLILTTGRIRDQWHTMTRTGKVQRLNRHIDRPFLQIHPDDAAARGIQSGTPVEVRSIQGNVRVNAQVTEQIKRGVVFLPMHFGKTLQHDLARANNLTRMAIDPISKQPDFKFTAVEVNRVAKQKEKIVVVGSGAAAYAFVSSYRELNHTDEIHVFSGEKDFFYNRILLPDYVNGELEWNRLKVVDSESLSSLNLTTYPETPIESIDIRNRTVTDSRQRVHSYDRLVLATGSRARLPENIEADLSGVFKVRDRMDADKMKAFLRENAHVLVVGAGLLGLEIAGALNQMNVQTTVLNRVDSLMRRQLDNLSSSLLAEILQLKQIAFHNNDEIETIDRKYGGRLSVTFKSGQVHRYDAVVFAIGTIPNIEIGKNAGLICRRGIVVDEYLTSSDPNVHAIGEIAEHNGQLWGIRSAAEEQGRILAGYINGNITDCYTGTVSMNILKIHGLDLIAIGQTSVPAGSTAFEEILFIDRAQRYYKKCIVKDDVLVGAILMGDKSEFAEFKSLIESRTELSGKRLQLLRSGKPAEPVLGVLVCSCNNVGVGNIEKIIQSGETQLEAVFKRTGAGMGCGSCKPEVKNILETVLANRVVSDKVS